MRSRDSSGAIISNIAIEQLQPGETEAEELVKIDVAGWSRRMDLPPQIGITWARLTNALREGLRPGTVRLGHRLDALDDGPDGTTSPSPLPARADPPRPPSARACASSAPTDATPRPRAHLRRGGTLRDAPIGASPTSPTAAPEANVYYALSPNLPGANGAGSFNELRFSLCDGSGISLLDVGRGTLDLEGANANSNANANSSAEGGQLMFGTTRFGETARAFQTPEERLAHLKTLFEGTTPLLQASIATTEPAGVVQTRLYERASARRWSRGRVTLLGDAAHCMYPSLGLGISTAFGDAVELSRRLGDVAKPRDGDVGVAGSNLDRDDVVRALEAYQRARVPTTWALQTASRLMHGVLAATAERPATEKRNGPDLAGCSSKCGADCCGCWGIENEKTRLRMRPRTGRTGPPSRERAKTRRREDDERDDARELFFYAEDAKARVHRMIRVRWMVLHARVCACMVLIVAILLPGTDGTRVLALRRITVDRR